MIRIVAIIGLFTVAACGADGEPIQPSVNAGVSLNNSGINSNVSLGARRGPFSINLGLL